MDNIETDLYRVRMSTVQHSTACEQLKLFDKLTKDHVRGIKILRKPQFKNAILELSRLQNNFPIFKHNCNVYINRLLKLIKIHPESKVYARNKSLQQPSKSNDFDGISPPLSKPICAGTNEDTELQCSPSVLAQYDITRIQSIYYGTQSEMATDETEHFENSTGYYSMDSAAPAGSETTATVASCPRLDENELELEPHPTQQEQQARDITCVEAATQCSQIQQNTISTDTADIDDFTSSISDFDLDLSIDFNQLESPVQYLCDPNEDQFILFSRNDIGEMARRLDVNEQQLLRTIDSMQLDYQMDNVDIEEYFIRYAGQQPSRSPSVISGTPPDIF